MIVRYPQAKPVSWWTWERVLGVVVYALLALALLAGMI